MNSEVGFKIVATIGVLSEYPTGWSKEANLVSWNGGPAKLDIRDWDSAHERMSRGLTLSAEEVKRLTEMLNAEDVAAKLEEINEEEGGERE